ncbi:MAG: protein-L-isoaspartate O-methyltransferase [Azospirillaceae bacterium]
MTDYATARANMVDGQIRTNRVTDAALIAAFREIPRELFVPKAVRGIAYVDEDIPLGHGRFLMEPMIFARLLQEARIGQGDVVLDIGCTRGYSTAIIARVADTVVAVETRKDLANEATKNLAELGVDNAAIVEGTLEEGYPSQAPYDVIVIEGGVSAVPDRLFRQLGDGGRLVTVVRQPGAVGRAVLYLKTGDTISHRILFDANTPILPGFEPVPEFEF